MVSKQRLSNKSGIRIIRSFLALIIMLLVCWVFLFSNGAERLETDSSVKTVMAFLHKMLQQSNFSYGWFILHRIENGSISLPKHPDRENKVKLAANSNIIFKVQTFKGLCLRIYFCSVSCPLLSAVISCVSCLLDAAIRVLCRLSLAQHPLLALLNLLLDHRASWRQVKWSSLCLQWSKFRDVNFFFCVIFLYHNQLYPFSTKRKRALQRRFFYNCYRTLKSN